MKSIQLIVFFVFCISGSVLAQPEAISSLKTNVELQPTLLKSFTDIYVYEIDTLSLPVLDDFSTNKFRKYNAKPGDANVSGVVFYQLMNGVTPLPDTAGFTTTVTNLIEYDTLPDGTDTIMFTPLPSTTVTINDLTSYPINGVSTVVYECFNIIDTLYTPRPPDTVYFPCTVVQDSVNVYFVTAIDNSSAIWLDYRAYHNYRYPVNPPTLGVATFDGLDENGFPYDFSLPLSYGIADYLTSKPIDLSGIPVGDSVYLSFFYQPQGLNNDPPAANDSLVLEFFNPASLNWENVWSVPGPNALKPFRQVMVPLLKSEYMNNFFQFRFKNYGYLSGNINHWHIDYVFLDRFRTAADTVRDDVAFRYKASTLLNNGYLNMPLTHFETNPQSFMRDTISVFQRNNNISGRLVGNNNMFVNHEVTNLFTVNNPATPSISGYTNFKTVFDVDNAGVVFDTSYADSCAVSYQVEFVHQTTPDDCRENDTMRFEQMFSNFYAYDDGSAEAAYGPIGAGAMLAYRYNLVKADAMYGMAIHFSPSVNDVDDKTFFLTVWDNSGAGGTPGTILYQETVLYDVVYGNATNKFHVYPFSTPLNVSGTIYIGWQQVDSDKLNIGMDFNHNNSSKIYYNVGFGWTNTSFPGSLLMRPVFNNCETDVVGVNENLNEENNFYLFPNPSNNIVQVGGTQNPVNVTVLDVTGKQLANFRNVNSFSVSGFSKGIYFVSIESGVQSSTQRLVVE